MFDFLSFFEKEPPIYGITTSRRFVMDEKKQFIQV